MTSPSKTILVVDDDKAITTLVSGILSAQGFSIVTANNGLTAIMEVKRCRPDLLIIDVVMPEINGYDVCRDLKFNGDYKDLPVIILTSRDRELDPAIGQKMKIDYVQKPIKPELLIEHVKAMIGTGAGSSAETRKQNLAEPLAPQSVVKPRAHDGPARILIVDDEPGTVLVASRKLEADGYQVSTVGNGEEALAFLNRQVPDLILMDVQMPLMNGYACLTAIRKHPFWTNIPVIMMTAHDHLEDLFFQLGVHGYIQKPFKLDDLLQKVSAIVTQPKENVL